MRTVHTYKFDSIDEIVDYLSGPCRLSTYKYDLEAITHEGFCKVVHMDASGKVRPEPESYEQAVSDDYLWPIILRHPKRALNICIHQVNDR